MIEATQTLANTYCEALGSKGLTSVANLLHTDARWIGPLSNVEGKETGLRAVTGFTSLLRSLRVKFSLSSEEQAMINYEADFGDPFGIVRSAALITCKSNLIARLDLFFDPRPFTENALRSSPGPGR